MYLAKRLYEKRYGRALLRVLTRPFISKIAGAFMDCRASRLMIKGFIKSYDIDMSDFADEEYKCFNSFFTRRLKEGARKTDMCSSSLISPCDGLLSVYSIDESLCFEVKNTLYSVNSLLSDERASEEFKNGACLVFRLTPANYHRYCYFDSGRKGENVFIGGVLHTVQPVAFENGVPVFKTNSREYCVMDTDNFGRCVVCEVGAMMVGRIVNYHGEHTLARGEEKGRFEFGGSTVIVLLKENAAKIDEKVLNSECETPVKIGQKIGEKAN